jgi:tRNA(fMet)-specific endonuclease VapC
MIRYVLDTDILSLLERLDAAVLNHLSRQQPLEVGITVISIDEQLSAWFTRTRRARSPQELSDAYGRLGKCVQSLSQLPILNFTVGAISRFEQLKRLKLGVTGNDLRIAAIALEFGCIVVTRNVRDFQLVTGLAIEDWSKP